MTLIGHHTSLGDVILKEQRDEGGTRVGVEIIQADPRVLISGELVRQLHRGEPNDRVPFASVSTPDVGGVLRIAGTNRMVVYRLTEFEPVFHGHRLPDTFIGEWPD